MTKLRTIWGRIAQNLWKGPTTEPAAELGAETVRALSANLEETARGALGRSLAIRHVDCGSCNGCELEIHGLNNIVYDLERFGLRFVASPRHADVLLVTGPLTGNLREALDRTTEATPDPKFIVGVGDCAVDGGVFKGSYAVQGGIGAGAAVDMLIPGCPPTPNQLLAGLRALIEANARGG
jgi:Ni,Fe-hydrogenase III small subunit